MKKILLIVSILLIIGFITIIILSSHKNVSETINVYSIPKSYCYKYKKDRRMSFEIYINDDNSIINLNEENTYKLKTNDNYFLLNNVTIDTEYNCVFENEEYYKYTINSDILNLNNVIIKECFLEIANKQFTILIKLGSLRLIDNDYDELIFKELYGNYTYVNKELYLCGITITLDDSYYKIYSLTIGEGFGNLEYIESDIYKDAEISFYELNHKIIDQRKIYDGIELKSNFNTYFIPVSYTNNYLLTNSPILLNIDHQSYYIDNYQFIITNIAFSNYEEILYKGDIEYAKI